MSGFDYITFLSDYGLTDEFVGVCHGVIRRIAPKVEIIDLTHGIKPQSVREGAMVLAQSVAYMPMGIHLAIVDPGVGSTRLRLAIEAKDGSMLVGPDNGILAMAAARLGGAVACRSIENPDFMLEKLSRTFHGRDVFAPAAAHLAAGAKFDDFGPEVALDALVGLTIAEPRRHDDHFHAVVLHVDRFGNLQLNLTPVDLADIGLGVGSVLEVRVEGYRSLITLGETFSAVPVGELVATEDSYGLVAVSINCGSAAGKLKASLGSSVILGPPGSGAED